MEVNELLESIIRKIEEAKSSRFLIHNLSNNIHPFWLSSDYLLKILSLMNNSRFD